MARTFVRAEQLKGTSLKNAQIAADAAISQSKIADLVDDLADKAPLASPTFTGTVTVPTATAGDSTTKSASTAFVANAIATALTGAGKRGRCRVATTANITIATALNNGDTLNGVTLATGDLVLVKNQTSSEDNGIYEVGASPARFSEFDTFEKHAGALITVTEGTTDADTVWFCPTNADGMLDTDPIEFTKLNFGASDSFATRETPSGTINGSNAEFTLDNTPVAGSEEVFVNGILQDEGSGNDYTISGDTITFEAGAEPQTGDKVRVSYRY